MACRGYAWLGFVGSGKLGLGMDYFVNLFVARTGLVRSGRLGCGGVRYGFYL